MHAAPNNRRDGTFTGFYHFLPFFRVMPGQRNGRSSPETYRAWVAKDFASATQGLPLELLGVAPATRQSGLHGLHLWSPAEAFLPPWHKLSFQRTRKMNMTLMEAISEHSPLSDFCRKWTSRRLWIICGDRSLVSILGCKSIGIPLLGVFFLPARTSLAPLTPSRFGLNHGTLRVQHGKVLFY